MRQGQGHSRGGGGGRQDHFQEEEAENPGSCILCFLVLVFLGYFITALCPSFPSEALPSPLNGKHHC